MTAIWLPFSQYLTRPSLSIKIEVFYWKLVLNQMMKRCVDWLLNEMLTKYLLRGKGRQLHRYLKGNDCFFKTAKVFEKFNFETHFWRHSNTKNSVFRLKYTLISCFILFLWHSIQNIYIFLFLWELLFCFLWKTGFLIPRIVQIIRDYQ